MVPLNDAVYKQAAHESEEVKEAERTTVAVKTHNPFSFPTI